MFNIECSDSAYNRIKGSEIEKKINKIYNESGGSLSQLFYDKEGEKLVNESKKRLFNGRGISEEGGIDRAVVRLSSLIKDDFLLDYNLREIFIENPSFLAYRILGKEIFDYKKFNFPSLRSLEEAITIYFIKEAQENSISYNRDRLIWRNNGKKNALFGDGHGDMYVSQIDVSSNERETKTLFGKEINFESIKHNPCSEGLYSHQDWSDYLISILNMLKD